MFKNIFISVSLAIALLTPAFALANTATASATWSTFYASNVVDGNLATYWNSNSFNCNGVWLAVQFNTVKTIHGVYYNPSLNGVYLPAFDVQTTMDGVTWVTVKQISGITSAAVMNIDFGQSIVCIGYRFVGRATTVPSVTPWLISETYEVLASDPNDAVFNNLSSKLEIVNKKIDAATASGGGVEMAYIPYILGGVFALIFAITWKG